MEVRGEVRRAAKAGDVATQPSGCGGRRWQWLLISASTCIRPDFPLQEVRTFCRYLALRRIASSGSRWVRFVRIERFSRAGFPRSIRA